MIVKILPQTATISFGTPIARDYINCEPYTGDYTITPSNEVQVLNTIEHRMIDNLTIEPIPSNYGLITWDGSVLTVS